MSAEQSDQCEQLDQRDEQRKLERDRNRELYLKSRMSSTQIDQYESRKLERDRNRELYLKSKNQPQEPQKIQPLLIPKLKETIYYVSKCRDCQERKVKCIKYQEGNKGQWDGYRRWHVEYQCPSCNHYVMQTLMSESDIIKEDVY